MADRFFTDQPLNLGEIVLDGAEAHHLAAVRRFVPGDTVTLFNGDGAEYPAEVLSAGKKQVVVVVQKRIEANRELPFPLVIASALPKGDRADFLLEKLVELGVTSFVPLICERSVVVPKEHKREKYERAVIEASKQCGRNRLMDVQPPCKFTEFVGRAMEGTKRILHTSLAESASDGSVFSPLLALPANKTLTWLVGPEGGFTEEEVSLAIQNGWQPASLGPRILRIETAAIAAAAISMSASATLATPS
jgi:16S rRNA (uracil1498-N3)-methyltransferase